MNGQYTPPRFSEHLGKQIGHGNRSVLTAGAAKSQHKMRLPFFYIKRYQFLDQGVGIVRKTL